MKKLAVIISIVFFLAFLIFCWWLFYPVRYALKFEDLATQNKEYFLLQWQQTTGSSWMIIGDQNGYYDEPEDIVAQGEMPFQQNFNYSIAKAENTYVCYGSYKGEIDISRKGEFLSEYQFTGWDILYPVKRDGLIPFLPKSYLCKYDMK